MNTYAKYYMSQKEKENSNIYRYSMCKSVHDFLPEWDAWDCATDPAPWSDAPVGLAIPIGICYRENKMHIYFNKNSVTNINAFELTICWIWCGWLPSSTLSCDSCDCDGGASVLMLSLIILVWLTLCDKFVGIGTPNGSICMPKLDWASILPCSSDVRSVDVEPDPD